MPNMLHFCAIFSCVPISRPSIPPCLERSQHHRNPRMQYRQLKHVLVEIFVCVCVHREFSCTSVGERILKIGPHLPKLLSNIKGYTHCLATSLAVSTQYTNVMDGHRTTARPRICIASRGEIHAMKFTAGRLRRRSNVIKRPWTWTQINFRTLFFVFCHNFYSFFCFFLWSAGRGTNDRETTPLLQLTGADVDEADLIVERKLLQKHRTGQLHRHSEKHNHRQNVLQAGTYYDIISAS